jgi:hypothetical protein
MSVPIVGASGAPKRPSFVEVVHDGRHAIDGGSWMPKTVHSVSNVQPRPGG